MELDFETIKRDYLPNEGDDDKMRSLKEAMECLNPAEQRIWLTYVECGTYTATAKEYNVSAPTAKKYITQLKNKILEHLEENDA